VPILLVLWDTEKIKGRADRLEQAIKEYGEILPLYDGSYLLSTEQESSKVFEALKRIIESDDNQSLLVLSVPQPYIGRAPGDVKMWLLRQSEKHLKNDAAKRSHSERSNLRED
jgi:hypothetical protein